MLAQSTGDFTREELKKDVKLSWTDKTKAEIAAAKGDNGNVNGNGNDNPNANPNANPNPNPNPNANPNDNTGGDNQGGGGDSGSIIDGTDEG